MPSSFATTFLPPLLALLLYLLFTFLLYPIIKRYRQRYEAYIPLEGARDRVAGWVLRCVLPRFRRPETQNDAEWLEDDRVGDEEGEEMLDLPSRSNGTARV
ncbi:hypothetical protein ANO11243_017540 [Dothideomycetidae sp. 11243]|nr:hypothetical protein ANO11243_017540 [fungal sp. No.11243]